MSAVLFATSFIRIGRLTSSIVISVALISVFWWIARKGMSFSALVSAHAVILANGLGAALGLFEWQLAGITFDSYLHLLGGFAAAMVFLDKECNGWKVFAYVMALGIALEIVEVSEVIFVLRFVDWPMMGENVLGWADACWQSFCPYWQDTAKDIINDALGAFFALLAAGSLSPAGSYWRKRARS